MNSGVAIRLTWDGTRVANADVAVSRPNGSRLLVGRTTDEVIEWVPRLYSLCGRAQTAAARLALQAAQGDVAALDEDSVRGLLAEQIQEHLWRLLRDWPPLLGERARDAEFGVWYRRLANADAGTGAELLHYLDVHCFAMPCEAWMRLDGWDALAAWARSTAAQEMVTGRIVSALLDQGGEALVPRCLPAGLTAGRFAAADWHGDFPQRPIWEGLPANTGAYARWSEHRLVRDCGSGLLASLVARLLDLCAAARSLADPRPYVALADACTPTDNVGLARVETARGMLLHRAEVLDGRVRHYAVVAPTEWNFHPDGDFAQALVGLTATDEAELNRMVAARVVAADPCVEWHLELHHA